MEECDIVILRAALADAPANSELAARDAEIERLSGNLSDLLCELTGGRLSKTTYEVRTMVQEVEAYFEETADEDAVAANAEIERLRRDLRIWKRSFKNRSERLIQERDARRSAEETLSRVEALAEEWDATSNPILRSAAGRLRKELRRAALADAPADA
jgi:hypothetical protein